MIRLRNNTPHLGSRAAAAEPQYSRLLQFLCARLANEQDAQELAQEAYLRLLRASDAKLIRDPVAYLFRIARNLLHEWYTSTPPPAEPLHEVELVDEGLTVEDRAELAQHMDRLEEVLRHLSPKCRAGHSHASARRHDLRRNRRQAGDFIFHGQEVSVPGPGAMPCGLASISRVLRAES